MGALQQYKGSPDLFQGNKWISEDAARGMGAFTSNPGEINSSVVDTVGTARPDLTGESDFARLSQKDIGWTDQGAGGAGGGSTDAFGGGFNLDVPNTIDAESIRSKFEKGFSSGDISGLMNDMRTRDARTAELMKPTDREKQLQQTLINTETSAALGLEKIHDQPIPMDLLVGQGEHLQKQASIQLDQIKKSIALETQNRMAEIEANKALSDSDKQQFGMFLQLDGVLREREMQIQTVLDRQGEKARSLFDTVLKNFEGLSYDELDPASQQQLSRIAQNIGLDPRILRAGMAVNKNKMLLKQKQQDFENSMASKEFDLNVSKYNLDVSKFKQEAANGGLTPAQINTTVNQIAGSFDNEPTVKNYNIVKEGYQFVQNLGTKDNPTSADDQGLVYAFAKAMDPNSAVKEGEYTTIQKYNQSLIQQGWANAKRITSNEAFLTPEARKNMIQTIKTKYSTAQNDYDNLHSEYQRQMDDAYSGKARQLTNYNNSSSGGGGINYQNMSNDDFWQSFSKDLNTSLNGSGNALVNKTAEAIAKIESSGRYNAMGPAIANGDRAYGKYQVMGANIPSWTKEILGKSLTPQQYLASPRAQDLVARGKMSKILAQYGGDPRQVASVWFSGQPMKGNVAKDVTGTSVPEYIRRFENALKSLA